MLYSDKAPEKPDTRVVDAKIVQRIWQDFAAYRVQSAGCQMKISRQSWNG